jgi:hypothetical protein
MIEDDFYATIKLNTGEEIFGKVVVSDEEDDTVLLVHTPVTVSEVKSRSGVIGYKLEPWLKTASDDLFVLKLENIITISESKDIEMIVMHQNFIEKFNKFKNKKSPKLTRRMGYISNIDDAKKLLEKIYYS